MFSLIGSARWFWFSNTLTHCGLVMPHGDIHVNWVDIDSGNDSLPGSIKPLSEPMLTCHQWGLVVFTWGLFHRKYFWFLPFIWVWKLLIQDYSHISQGLISYNVVEQLYMRIWIHDDVIKWKHFPRCWPFVRGIKRSPVNSPHKGQWRRALMFLWSALV